MKKNILMFVLLFSLVQFVSQAFGLNLGTNITIYDEQEDTSKVSTTTSMGYTGIGVGREDQETEPATTNTDVWDLEAMFIKGTNLSMVGQWDFINGVSGYTSGDIFIEISNTRPPARFDGYDYVFDIDWLSKTYDLYKINSGQYVEVSYVHNSDYWKIDEDNSDLTLLASGTITTLVDNTLPFYGNTDHNVVTGFDMSPILTDLSVKNAEFYAHFTLKCGNDELEGHGTAVPEPATLIILGCGLIGLGAIGSERLLKS